MVFRLQLLGGAGVEVEGVPLCGAAGQRRCIAVLAVLAAAPHGRTSRDKLIGYVWPESANERAHDHLVDAVYALRKALGRDAILSAGQDLLLNPVVVSTDVGDFTSAIERGDLAAAVSVYQGPFLDGFFLSSPDFEQWVDGVRGQLARSYERAIETLATECEARGDFHGAVEWWSRLSAHDPYSSRVVLRLMRALAASGDRAGVLRCARAHELLLRENLGIEADQAVLQLAEQVRTDQGGLRDGAALRQASVFPLHRHGPERTDRSPGPS